MKKKGGIKDEKDKNWVRMKFKKLRVKNIWMKNKSEFRSRNNLIKDKEKYFWIQMNIKMMFNENKE